MNNFSKNFLPSTLVCCVVAGCATDDTQMQSPTLCASSEYYCDANVNGLVIGTAKPLPNYLPVIDDAYERYSQFFKSERLKTAIFSSDRISDTTTNALEKSGYTILLPWMPAGSQKGLPDAAIRAQITAQMPNASQEMIDNLVMQARAQLPQNAGNSLQDPEIEAGTIAHELAHMWFIKGRWEVENKNTTDTSSRKYGSNAPDWLDEIVAVLTETDVMAHGRQRRLETIMATDGFDALWPLKTYFTMEHPVFKRAQSLINMRDKLGKTERVGGRTTIRLTGEDAKNFLATDSAQKPGNFYTQSRAFADFMIETSGRPYIFDDITDALKSGDSMEIWLSKAGRNYGLPTSIDALEIEWKTWLLNRASKTLTP